MQVLSRDFQVAASRTCHKGWGWLLLFWFDLGESLDKSEVLIFVQTFTQIIRRRSQIVNNFDWGLLMIYPHLWIPWLHWLFPFDFREASNLNLTTHIVRVSWRMPAWSALMDLGTRQYVALLCLIVIWPKAALTDWKNQSLLKASK